ncbi:hypothetical protein CKAH01_09850 [Colletotrichum kahawae]|uniref:Uncharacterized protein n=1 Tax=Colletotrichum kahawae TaxID=34407 RepID=A0AAD9Y050_COLKA|nr:hypothetical protein CKAH01_09850 [Colletotrichum kahawae]
MCLLFPSMGAHWLPDRNYMLCRDDHALRLVIRWETIEDDTPTQTQVGLAFKIPADFDHVLKDFGDLNLPPRALQSAPRTSQPVFPEPLAGRLAASQPRPFHRGMSEHPSDARSRSAVDQRYSRQSSITPVSSGSYIGSNRVAVSSNHIAEHTRPLSRPHPPSRLAHRPSSTLSRISESRATSVAPAASQASSGYFSQPPHRQASVQPQSSSQPRHALSQELSPGSGGLTSVEEFLSSRPRPMTTDPLEGLPPPRKLPFRRSASVKPAQSQVADQSHDSNADIGSSTTITGRSKPPAPPAPGRNAPAEKKQTKITLRTTKRSLEDQVEDATSKKQKSDAPPRRISTTPIPLPRMPTPASQGFQRKTLEPVSISGDEFPTGHIAEIPSNDLERNEEIPMQYTSPLIQDSIPAETQQAPRVDDTGLFVAKSMLLWKTNLFGDDGYDKWCKDPRPETLQQVIAEMLQRNRQSCHEAVARYGPAAMDIPLTKLVAAMCGGNEFCPMPDSIYNGRF